MFNTENLLLLNTFVATGTLLLEFIVLIAFVILVYTRIHGKENRVWTMMDSLIRGNDKTEQVNDKITRSYIHSAILFIFVMSLFSSIMTLIYSEGFGLVPCALCWIERVFMYGITFITGTALFARNEL